MSESTASSQVEQKLEESGKASYRSKVGWLMVGVVLGAAGTKIVGSPAQTVPPLPPEDATRSAAARVIRLNPSLAERARIETQRIDFEAMVPTLELVGRVSFDPEHVADIGGRLEGRVTAVYVELGDRVKEGDSLVAIEGPKIGDAVAALLEAKAELAAARAQAERQALLRREQLTTAVAAEQALAEERALEARVRGAEQQLAALGIPPALINTINRSSALPRSVILRAPISGEVVERNVHLGAVVDPTHPLLRIADLDRMWVVLEAYERDVGRLRVGDKVEIRLESEGQPIAIGSVNHISSLIDEETRTADVRVEIDNKERRLRAGQFVQATAYLSGEAVDNVLLVPTSAVTQVGGVRSVFVRVGENTYEVKPVETAQRVGNRLVVLRGLLPGDEVVTAGIFALKSEMER
ncbi:MAG: efflux RND transporter periplasmic adaptor subunit [Sandaracinaceae bacterium]|nr:efflux RND transporter periplasmic adaptor subunit [Sandaracinaceae bacterium]MDW8245987.1 efflux RND transporter periplasmic adaptor subunit [Sandaracinaceae bacterium]